MLRLVLLLGALFVGTNGFSRSNGNVPSRRSGSVSSEVRMSAGVAFATGGMTSVAFGGGLRTTTTHSSSFRPPHDVLRSSSFCNRVRSTPCNRRTPGGGARRGSGSRSQLNMFLGQDSGIFGVGAPEVLTIVLVGYFILGPTELYKLTKEIGKFVQNIRSLGTEATAGFEGAMENQLQLEELRKAQAELTDAFSFRRSINYSEDVVDAPFAERESTAAPVAAAAATSTATATATGTATDEATSPPRKKKKKKVKRRKKQPEVVEDLDMSAASFDPVESPFADQSKMAEEVLRQQEDLAASSSAREEEEKARFQNQLSSTWNDEILSKEEELTPLAAIMEKIALLEEERGSAMSRLEEEFRMKEELEEKFYRQKRAILEDAAAEVQKNAYESTEVSKEASNSEKVGNSSSGSS